MTGHLMNQLAGLERKLAAQAERVDDGTAEPTLPPPWQPSELLSKGERALAARDTFVDRYARFACRRTDAPACFHEAMGLVALSVLVGRRAVLRLASGEVYPSLWVLILADSTLYRKSTAMDLARELVEGWTASCWRRTTSRRSDSWRFWRSTTARHFCSCGTSSAGSTMD
ncbi:MAG: primase, phage related [Chloroflexi bacterium]|nr:primase, phage related [Chloroflexota bacterium]